ncbi:hypothetical protein K505DRAFT_348158 [Melanomma pulvis-pyrius CBS 109.77]|uniref:Uncharacterized protein n=1 Tax=Melanomma pulvis-pyrius CBS 109.77 TaxID=1314802 RepID=A0A6A6XIR9_9PLEO|nr:hypothetical protein K505DRAFT_348158 [Melanomma pulvis-pyrius CBS 109.77]
MEIARTSIPEARCCCGNRECAFLAHNGKLLEGLENNVSKAAQLGKALLVRHEAYVADSERERRQMSATIDSLEQEKFELENRNAQTIKANRDLLDKLEQLNDAVADSDDQIRMLTNTLHSTEQELQRLSSLAARTQSLERQLIDLEREQAQLQGTLEDKVGDERTAIQRWKRAETTIGDLQDQIDRIEKEAREEHERHLEIVARMERRIAVDGELATAAGRLKAQAGHEKSGSSVVSHFVKDILLDNTNLQHGILELREMLMCSNEEVELLREQLRAHQPVSPTTEDVAAPSSLQRELGNDAVFNPELHIHHHYHNPPQRKETPVKVLPQRRPRKKRFSLTFTPPAPPDPSSPAAILSQATATVPPNTNRWSNATTLAPSSVPGSPLSMSHRGSVYDRVFSDVAYDSSRPTSPSDSVDLASPSFGPSKARESLYSQDLAYRHQRRKSQSLKPPSLSTIRSASTPISLTAKSSPATAIISAISPANSLANDIFTLSPSLHAAIPEEIEDPPTQDTNYLTSPTYDSDEAFSPTTHYRPSLRRAASHESLISVSGMDIHTLQSRPAQLLFSSTPHFSSPGSGTSIKPELTPWTATATGSMTRRNLDSSTRNRSLLHSTIANQKRGINSAQKPAPNTLGKKVGGWVFGKWGAGPTVSPLRPVSSASSNSQSTQGSSKKKDEAAKRAEKELKLRPAGVNQSGPIWGFFDAIPPTPTKVVVTELDEDALGDALTES